MKTEFSPLRAALWIGWACASLATASGEPPRPDTKPDEAPTAKVTRGSIQAKVSLETVVEAEEMHPLKISPKVWTDLTFLEAVPHGTQVKAGETLAKLDTEKLKDQIDDLEKDQPAARVALELALAEWENLQETTPGKLEAAQRSHRIAGEDYAHFEETGREQREKSARFRVKSAEQSLENALEELNQLEKMYKADDLTEETEEIILKRQKFSVEAARNGLENTRAWSERELDTLIPREYDSLKTVKRDSGLALELSRESLPRALTKKHLEAEKLKRDLRKAEKKLADLRTDLEQMTIRAPAAGLVYYGLCENGKWNAAAAMAKKLVPNGKLAPNEVFMTVVNPERVFLRAIVPEGDFGYLKPGLRGDALPTSAPGTRIPLTVESLGEVPAPGGGFDAKLALEIPPGLRLAPGMTCKANFENLPRPEMLLAPKEAVFTEAAQKYVFVKTGERAPEKRLVKTGESDEKRTEIIEGLSEGEMILLKKPE